MNVSKKSFSYRLIKFMQNMPHYGVTKCQYKILFIKSIFQFIGFSIISLIILLSTTFIVAESIAEIYFLFLTKKIEGIFTELPLIYGIAIMTLFFGIMFLLSKIMKKIDETSRQCEPVEFID